MELKSSFSADRAVTGIKVKHVCFYTFYNFLCFHSRTELHELIVIFSLVNFFIYAITLFIHSL